MMAMLLSVVLGTSVVFAVWPAVLFCINLRRFQPPPDSATDQHFSISVLIPARNEAANIGDALAHVLRSRDVALDVLVWDDDSTDNTVDIVEAVAAGDSRVRLLHGQMLPPGWNGKQHACWQLAQAAHSDVLAFLDADVRIEPDLLARMAAFRAINNKGLVSGFPRLITITWLEQLLLPLIHFVLLAFLPMRAMRRRLWPSAAAGCGQFLLVQRDAYFAAGGHSAIRETMHDGLLLPRVLRNAGYRTDIADITDLASVRMYDSAVKVWNGLAKNATEGIATPGRIVPLSLVLFFGQVLPSVVTIALLASALWVCFLGGPQRLDLLLRSPRHGVLFAFLWLTSLTASFVPRLLAVRRFRQPLRSAMLHPLGITVLLILQWYALGRKLFGRPVGWRQRTYSSGTGAEMGSGI